MIHTFGIGEPVVSQKALLAMLLRVRARSGRTATVARVARLLHPGKGTITPAEVLAVAAQIPTLITVSGNTLTLTTAGLYQARHHPSSRYAIR